MIIFDLDGTLALCDHRRHFVQGPKKDWDAFNEACDRDEPNWSVLWLLDQLVIRAGLKAEIWSGRMETVRGKTEEWLIANSDAYERGIIPLLMRPAGDYTDDVDLKLRWLNEARAAGRTIDFVVDDRQKVVDMWRREGITCLQCAPGDF